MGGREGRGLCADTGILKWISVTTERDGTRIARREWTEAGRETGSDAGLVRWTGLFCYFPFYAQNHKEDDMSVEAHQELLPELVVLKGKTRA